MLVDHTKFSPDRFFGLIKKTYSLSTISTINELEQVVRRSSAEQTIPPLIQTIFGVLQITFHQWTVLNNFYIPIPNITELFVVRECVQQFTVTLEDMTVLATNAGLSASDHLLLGFGLSASLAPAEHKGLRTQCTTSD